MASKRNSDSNNLVGKVRKAHKGKKGQSWSVDFRGHEKLVESLGLKVRESFKSKAEAEDRQRYISNLIKEKASSASRFVGKFSDDERLITVQLMEAFNQSYPEVKLHQVVEAGIKSERERLNDEGFPTLGDYITKEFLPYWLKKDAGRQSPRDSKKEYATVKLALELILESEELSSMKLNVCFKPKTNIFRKMTVIVNSMAIKEGRKKGQPIVINQKHKRAGYIQRIFDKIKQDYNEIEQANPLKKFQAQWISKKPRPIPKILPLEKVRELFAIAVEGAKRSRIWSEQIPYMALIFFSGCRPWEVRGVESHRVWNWRNMRKWNDFCKKSEGGILITVPNVDKKTGYRTAKPKHTTDRVLFPSGLEWLRWWLLVHKAEKSLPLEGEYKASLDAWKNIRTHLGLGGENSKGNQLWDQDTPRHMLCSSAHRWKPYEKAYWLDKCAHSEAMFKDHYMNPEVDMEYAKEYLFSILPPNLDAQRQKEKEYQVDRKKANDEAVRDATKKGDHSFDDPNQEHVVEDNGTWRPTKIDDYWPEWFKRKYSERLEDEGYFG